MSARGTLRWACRTRSGCCTPSNASSASGQGYAQPRALFNHKATGTLQSEEHEARLLAATKCLSSLSSMTFCLPMSKQLASIIPCGINLMKPQFCDMRLNNGTVQIWNTVATAVDSTISHQLSVSLQYGRLPCATPIFRVCTTYYFDLNYYWSKINIASEFSLNSLYLNNVYAILPSPT